MRQYISSCVREEGRIALYESTITDRDTNVRWKTQFLILGLALSSIQTMCVYFGTRIRNSKVNEKFINPVQSIICALMISS